MNDWNSHERTPERITLGSNGAGYTVWDFWNNELKDDGKNRKRFLNEVGVMVMGDLSSVDDSVLDELSNPALEQLTVLFFG